MLEDIDKSTLLKLARQTLESHFAGEEPPEPVDLRAPLLSRKGAFVSLHQDGELRGCIGQIFPYREVYKTVRGCAFSAAFEDSRFPPVTLEELPRLTIEISILSPLRSIQSVEEIEVGRHGIYMIKGFHNRGLLLPQVAVEYKWNRMEFLTYTCRKSGLPDTAWRDPETEIYIFDAEVFSEEPE